MTGKLKLFAAEIEMTSLFKRMLLGAFIGFLIISVFVWGVEDAPAEWPLNWKVRPLLITPLAGAFGMLSFYLGDLVGARGEWPRILLLIVSVLLFLVSLWLGTVLGLAGTMWN